MKNFKFRTVFSSSIQSVISKERDIYLAKASLEELRNLIPNIDADKNYDLLPISANLFNVNMFNKNDDGVDTSFALQIYKSFINKPWNLEHSRDRNIGVILSTHITELSTDKLIDEEDVKKRIDPFNITIGGVIWRVVNEGLAELIEGSNDLLSDGYNKLFCSFEVGFTDYKVVLLPPNSFNLAQGKIVEENKEELSANLRAFGGTGKLKDGTRVVRLLSGEGIGLGAAITETPAARNLSPVAVNKETETITEASTIVININQGIDPEFNKSATDLSEVIKRVGDVARDTISEVDNLISHSQTLDVINNSNCLINKDNLRKYMKINNIKDITDDLLKECKASSIVDFVETELKVASEKFSKEKQEKETQAQEIQKKHEELIKTHEQLMKDLETLKANLQKLENEKAAKEKQEKFNVRMVAFEDKYELSEEEVSVVAAQIKDLNDEDYKKVETNLYILLKNKDKQIIAAQKKGQEAKASETKETKTDQQTVDTAIDKAEKVSKEIAATQTTTTTQSLREKYSKAFSLDQFTITK